MTLPLGEFEGQLAQKICTQPCLGQWHRWARRPDLTAAPHGQRQLQTQRLIERQPAARLLLFGGVLRHVDLAQRLVEDIRPYSANTASGSASGTGSNWVSTWSMQR